MRYRTLTRVLPLLLLALSLLPGRVAAQGANPRFDTVKITATSDSLCVGVSVGAACSTASGRIYTGTAVAVGGIAIKGGTPSDGGIVIPADTPASTTNNLYSPDGTTLWFGASQLATGSSVSGTTNRLGKFTGATSVGDSSITDNGSLVSTSLPAQFGGLTIVGAAAVDVTYRGATGQAAGFTLQADGAANAVDIIKFSIADGGAFTINASNGANPVWSSTAAGAVTIPDLTVTTLNGYTINQSVANGAAPTFLGTNFSSIPWAAVSKTGSSLADLATRAIANLSDGSNAALLNGSNTFSSNGTQTFGSGGTGSGTPNFFVNGGSGAAGGAFVALGKNGASNAFFGHISAILGSGTSSEFMMYGDTADGVSIRAAHASGDLKLYSRNALAVTFGAAQLATFTGNVAIGAKYLSNDGANEGISVATDGSVSIIGPSNTTSTPYLFDTSSSAAIAWVRGGEGVSGQINIAADDGDDNNDIFTIQSLGGGDVRFRNGAGSNYLTFSGLTAMSLPAGMTLTIPDLASSLGTRYVCSDVAGTLVDSVSACSGSDAEAIASVPNLWQELYALRAEIAGLLRTAPTVVTTLRPVDVVR